MHIVPVIICGGAGSRLWPLSRENHPKPLIRLADGLSLIQHAFLRALALPRIAELVTVTNRELFFAIDDEYRQLGHNAAAMRALLEPEGRNTAAAIAAASLEVADRLGGEAILFVMPADHVIAERERLAHAVEEACALAGEGRLVTFGIRPDRPETGYGYIEADGINVRRFVEKPESAAAEEFVASGRFLWNSGMFCFQAQTMIDEMERFCPDIPAGCRAALGAGRRLNGQGTERIELDPERFAEVPSVSIDYAVLEKASNVAVVSCDIGWSDIGSWAALGEQYERDADGNRVLGNVASFNAHGNVVRGSDRLIGLVGVDDLVIADTPDALLVTSKENAQDVRLLYNRLKDLGDETHRVHRTVFRPWGSYTVLEEGPRFKIKRIEVKPGAQLSLQMHHHRAEHWVVVSGTARIVNGEREILLTTDQSAYIPCGQRHRLENPGILNLVLIEVQTGDYLGEDDIVRFDDVYGRG
ncbi:mannose-1-phosphate guanylyltransferase/mannose-6-phosphate isomerase [Chelativorans sp. YIM 93263]|uniref:mannose-1-phosphate guanylyltransferase/mannose-6-phosphate isomerase n=1 Tax=Chelativorans sp. YIM 93263 TaxID=2906648 RepID=UPI002377ECE7|nr:mannose-1-phosphate guanylyltransferase/mannose-6-phosphate isomerase [Chelativorans sp. YIM 93263]